MYCQFVYGWYNAYSVIIIHKDIQFKFLSLGAAMTVVITWESFHLVFMNAYILKKSVSYSAWTWDIYDDW